MRFLDPIIAFTSPIAETVLLGGLPSILMIFLCDVVLFKHKLADRPPWEVRAVFAVLAISMLVAIWRLWFAPGGDSMVVCERGFRWQVSWSRLGRFRSKGGLAFQDLKSFSYRADSFEPEPVECGTTTAEKLTRIWLECHLSRHDIQFRLEPDRKIVVEKFLARFDPDDLRRFLEHLDGFAERREIDVRSKATKVESG